MSDYLKLGAFLCYVFMHLVVNFDKGKCETEKLNKFSYLKSIDKHVWVQEDKNNLWQIY